MTIWDVIRNCNNIEIDLLLAHVLKTDKEFLFANPNYKLTTKQINTLSKLAHRRSAGEPVAYILGYKYFYGLKFKVNPNVLIPRPETEWLVEKSLNIIKKFYVRKNEARPDSGYKILDMGTGSGCVAISLVDQLKQTALFGSPNTNSLPVKIYASDISKNALKVAKKNANARKAKINFINSNLFQKIKDRFDLVTANLPYVPKADYKKLKAKLKFEPVLALTDGTNTWQIYHRFFQELPDHLKPGACVLLEIDPKAKKYLIKYIKMLLPQTKFTFFNDLNKFSRYLQINL